MIDKGSTNGSISQFNLPTKDSDMKDLVAPESNSTLAWVLLTESVPATTSEL